MPHPATCTQPKPHLGQLSSHEVPLLTKVTIRLEDFVDQAGVAANPGCICCISFGSYAARFLIFFGIPLSGCFNLGFCQVAFFRHIFFVKNLMFNFILIYLGLLLKLIETICIMLKPARAFMVCEAC